MIRMMSRETGRHDPAQGPAPDAAPGSSRPSGESAASRESGEVETPGDERLAQASDANAGTVAVIATGDRHDTPEARLRRVVDRHYDALWRTLRYLGVPDAGVDDAAQQALCVLARRLNDVVPGTEMPFLFAIAVRVASDVRRSARRDRSQPVQDIDGFTGGAPSADELVDERKAREVLRQVLEALPEDLRVVFVFYEIEELGLAEIAQLLGIPVGTVSSRLRRARDRFQAIVRRHQARMVVNSAPAKSPGKVRT
jgi:RNA polymerase sigma-70 factor (ECF subfamily)